MNCNFATFVLFATAEALTRIAVLNPSNRRMAAAYGCQDKLW
jgi:hypothetical protein